MRLLKDFLDKFDQIGVTTFIKNIEGENILMQQSRCNHIERIFNGKFIEMNYKDNENTLTNNIVINNNPYEIVSNTINDAEEAIAIFYDDVIINMIGYKK